MIKIHWLIIFLWGYNCCIRQWAKLVIRRSITIVCVCSEPMRQACIITKYLIITEAYPIGITGVDDFYIPHAAAVLYIVWCNAIGTTYIRYRSDKSAYKYLWWVCSSIWKGWWNTAHMRRVSFSGRCHSAPSLDTFGVGHFYIGNRIHRRNGTPLQRGRLSG